MRCTCGRISAVAMAKKVPEDIQMAMAIFSGDSERKNRYASKAPAGVVSEKSKLKTATLRRLQPADNNMEVMEMLSGIL